MKILDNFLSDDKFTSIQNIFLGQNIPWFFYPFVDFYNDSSRFQFVHMLYENNHGISSGYAKDIIDTFKDKLDAYVFLRIKSNLSPNSQSILVNNFHTDFEGDICEKSHTAIYYVNTNNGYTLFEDGTKVESVGNRIVIFPSHMRHCGTTCTDAKSRVLINFNYFS